MSLLLNNFFFKNLKIFLYPIIIFLILIEIIFQIIFFFDIKPFKKTILYFNPYCDQAYWNFEGNSSYDETEYSYHPILTLVKKNNEIFFKKNKKKLKKDIIFYGSSFIDHKYFVTNFKDKTNFAIKSYGIDQIYKSYILTKENFPGDTIVFGFLLEDLDRALFHQRNFPKLKYVKIKDNYELSNTPIQFEKNLKKEIHFFTYNFFKNVSFLVYNEFNYKKSKCNINKKKDIFKFFITEIISHSNQLNQNVIFITFNFQDDLSKPSWRYNFIKNYFSSKRINHIDLFEIINLDMKNNNLSKKEYYNTEDFHLSEYGFELAASQLNSLIAQYK